VPIWHIKNKKL